MTIIRAEQIYALSQRAQTLAIPAGELETDKASQYVHVIFFATCKAVEILSHCITAMSSVHVESANQQSPNAQLWPRSKQRFGPRV